MKFKFNIKYPAIALFLILFNFLLNAQDRSIKTPISKQISKYELGIRYLKLGNTYREASEFHLAKKYLDKGASLVKHHGNAYWNATTNEFFGYLYRDMNLKDKALEYLNYAADIYMKIIKVEGGSHEAILKVISSLEAAPAQNVESKVQSKSTTKSNLNNGKGQPTTVDNQSSSSFSKEINLLRTEKENLLKDNEELIKTNQELADHVKELENNIELLKKELGGKKNQSNVHSQFSIPNDNSGIQMQEHENKLLNDNNVPTQEPGSKLKPDENLSNEEKEKRLMKTGYSYQRGNIIVDMYGNKIEIEK